jgi:hypothetical protein
LEKGNRNMETMNPELVDELDGVTYVLTATRCYVTWQVQRGHRLMTERKRLNKGQPITGIPEANLAKLVKLGHAVPVEEYDPEALAVEKLRKRLMYDQGAASSALLEFTLAKNRQAAGMKEVGLPDADAKLTDSGYEVDGIKVEDVAGSGANAENDDDELTDTNASAGAQGGAPAEDYRGMDYPSLQQYAKQVTGSGAGGKEEIVARLDEHFGVTE